MEVADQFQLLKLDGREAADGSLPIYRNGDRAGVMLRAHDLDESLSAPVLLENLACKTTGALALQDLLGRTGFPPDQLQYAIGCGEEAVGDRYQRGGGNLGKAIAEEAGCANASGSDVKAFCAGPLHALVVAGSLVSAGVYEHVAVVAGGSLAKLGMKFQGHVKRGMPIVEDVLAGFAAHVGRNDGVSPGTQGIREDPSWEAPAFRLFDAIHGAPDAALLARQEGWWRANRAHPTAAVWARWTQVKDWDGLELAERFPDWAMACHGIRATATNHFTGDGWWAWCIPLQGGEVSVGVVFDQRRVRWPEGGPLGERLKNFLMQHPVAREILTGAHWREGDVHWRKHLPYCSTTFAGDGFVLVGDASAFLDPLYSPGMDWISFTVSSATRLILSQQRGEAVAPLVAKHNREFARSYHRWFTAIYRDKYEYLGEYDLLRLVFLLDLGFYYLGVASQPFKRGKRALCEPVFTTAHSRPFYLLMRWYNRRFAEMARSRRARARLGRRNAGRRFLFGGYTFARSSALTMPGAGGGSLPSNQPSPSSNNRALDTANNTFADRQFSIERAQTGFVTRPFERAVRIHGERQRRSQRRGRRPQ